MIELDEELKIQGQDGCIYGPLNKAKTLSRMFVCCRMGRTECKERCEPLAGRTLPGQMSERVSW